MSAAARSTLGRRVARWSMWSAIVVLLLLVFGLIALVWMSKEIGHQRRDRRFAVCCVVDLGDGQLGLTALNDSRAYFDLDRDGFAEWTGWFGRDQALLAEDTDGDGRIADAGELLPGKPDALRQYLAALDANRDGFLDTADPGFASLVAWRDEDGDGTSEAGELYDLPGLGIERLDASPDDVAEGETRTGHAIVAAGTVVASDGTTRPFAAVRLMHSQLESRYIGPVPDVPEVAGLPDLRGSGDMANLRVAMSLDPDLREAVKRIVRADLLAGEDVEAPIIGMMLRWARADGVAPDSRGRNIDARILATVERFMGEPFVQIGNRSNPAPNAAKLLVRSWLSLLQAQRAHLLLQGPLAWYFPGVRYAIEEDRIAGVPNVDLAIVRMAIQAPQARAEALGYWRTMLRTLRQVAEETLPGEGVRTRLLEAAAEAADLGLGAEEIMAGLAVEPDS